MSRCSRRPRRALERLERRTALGLLIVQALAPGTLPTPVVGRDAGCRGVKGPVPQPLSMNTFGENAITRVPAATNRPPTGECDRPDRDRPAYLVRMAAPGLDVAALVAAKQAARHHDLRVPPGPQRGADRRPDRGHGAAQPRGARTARRRGGGDRRRLDRRHRRGRQLGGCPRARGRRDPPRPPPRLGQGQRALDVAVRVRGRHRVLARRRRAQLRAALRHPAGRTSAHRPRHRVREGLLPPAAAR